MREQTINDLLAAYVSWREESMTVHETYARCRSERGQGAGLAYGACLAALDREQRAAAVYARTVDRAAQMFGASPP